MYSPEVSSVPNRAWPGRGPFYPGFSPIPSAVAVPDTAGVSVGIFSAAQSAVAARAALTSALCARMTASMHSDRRSTCKARSPISTWTVGFGIACRIPSIRFETKHGRCNLPAVPIPLLQSAPVCSCTCDCRTLSSAQAHSGEPLWGRPSTAVHSAQQQTMRMRRRALLRHALRMGLQTRPDSRWVPIGTPPRVLSYRYCGVSTERLRTIVFLRTDLCHDKDEADRVVEVRIARARVEPVMVKWLCSQHIRTKHCNMQKNTMQHARTRCNMQEHAATCKQHAATCCTQRITSMEDRVSATPAAQAGVSMDCRTITGTQSKQQPMWCRPVRGSSHKRRSLR